MYIYNYVIMTNSHSVNDQILTFKWYVHMYIYYTHNCIYMYMRQCYKDTCTCTLYKEDSLRYS